MKKIFLSVVATVLLSMNVFAATSNSTKIVKDDVSFSLGTCTLTFTEYNSSGEAIRTWTETYWAYSYQNCQDLGNYRLKELSTEPTQP